MDKQLGKSEADIEDSTSAAIASLAGQSLLKTSSLAWAAIVVLAIGLGVLVAYQVQMSDPYIKTVISLSGDPVRGSAIFQMNCSGCHWFHRGTQVGPSLYGVSQRRSRMGLIRQVTSGKTPPMPQFKPNPQEMADLLSYLEKL